MWPKCEEDGEPAVLVVPLGRDWKPMRLHGLSICDFHEVDLTPDRLLRARPQYEPAMRELARSMKAPAPDFAAAYIERGLEHARRETEV